MLEILISLIILLATGIILYLLNESKKDTTPATRFRSGTVTRNVQERVEDTESSLRTTATNAGLDADEIMADIESGTDETCIVPFPCPDGFIENSKTGCCDLPSGADKERKQMLMKLGTEIGAIILVELAIEMAVIPLGLKLMGKLAPKLAARMSLFMGRMTMKTGLLAGTGPLGVAMMAFEVISMTLDIVDVEGYGLHSGNKTLEGIRNRLEYTQEVYCKANGLKYPMVFSGAMGFEGDFAEAFTIVFSEFLPDVLVKAFDVNEEAATRVFINGLTGDGEVSDDDMNVMYMVYNDLFIYSELPRQPDETVEQYEQRVRDNAPKRELALQNSKRRDEIIYDALSDIMFDPTLIEYIPENSDGNQSGISLSEKGAMKWNEANRDTYLKYFDLFGNEADVPDDFSPPFYATYTDTYRVLNTNNPGTQEKPNMLTAKLPRKMCLAVMSGPMVAFCEKKREGGFGKAKINPLDYDVKLDDSTMLCNYTPSYCERMGLQYGNYKGVGDCKNYEGQYIAELLFGTSITRGAIKAGNNVYECTQDPTKCANDWVKAQVDCIKDPVKCAEKSFDAPIRLARGIPHAISSVTNMLREAAGKYLPKPYEYLCDNTFGEIGMGDFMCDPVTKALEVTFELVDKFADKVSGVLLEGWDVAWDGLGTGYSEVSKGAEKAWNEVRGIFSDMNLKMDIVLVQEDFVIPGIHLYEYTWNKTATELYGLRGRYRGVIAQEVEQYYPGLVRVNTRGHKFLLYNRIIEYAIPELAVMFKVEKNILK